MTSKKDSLLLSLFFASVVVVFTALYLSKQNPQPKNFIGMMTPTPTPTFGPIDPNTKLFEPNLVSTSGWKIISLPQNIIVSQSGLTMPGKVEFSLPGNWNIRTVQKRTNKGIGGAPCNDFQITNTNNTLLLVIKPACGDTNNEYIPINGQVHIVNLITNKGNDHHDSYTVRYFDSVKNTYHYGSIDISPKATIDIQKNIIYQNLILQFKPDRLEQWLWTSYDVTYTGAAAGESTALRTADTIISTLKLTD